MMQNRTIFLLLCLLMGLAACGGPSEEGAVENRGGNTAGWYENLPRPEWAAFERVLPDLDWFEVYAVSEGVFAIYEPQHFEEVISFLIVGEARALLFDTGLGLSRLAPVVRRLTNLDVMVLNSHSHFDHVGGNHEFEAIAGLDNAYAARRAQGLGNDIVGDYVRGDWLAAPPSPDFDPAAYEIKPWMVSKTIHDGDVIDLGGRRLEVIETPGHSPDALCLLDRENRLLFTGDTFYLAPLYAHLEGSDFATYAASVEKLAALAPAVDHLMTAHNVPMADGAYLLRLREAFEAVANGGASYVETDGAHEYAFDGFSIIAPAALADGRKEAEEE